MSNWNPLYPFDEDVSPLEEAAREAEWEDDMRRAEKKRREENGLEDENGDIFVFFK